MENNLRKRLKDTKGITLVALVVTIIVLLILAGVALSSVLSQDGIFSRAEQATDKYGKSKARETLELALGEAQMQKHEEGLTDEQLDNQIAKIEGELLPKEKPDYPNLQNVIVDGYIFEIDRSVPKIVDYIGPADGIIITAYVSGNDGWVKPDEKVTVKGSIKIYGGGTVTSSSAVATNGVTIPTDFPTVGGSFTIPNISVDTDITITATDSDNETVNKKIEVRIKRDGTAPTVETLTAKTEGLTIKFTATGHDQNVEGQEESGIDYFTYTISSTQDKTLEGIPEKQRTGTFKQGQTVEIMTTPTGNREETTYIIKVTATDNCKNTTLDTNAKTENVTVIDGLTIEQAKKLVNTNTLQGYMGIRITDYNPPAGGTYRVFYFDSEGYFGPQNIIYLIRDQGVSWFWGTILETTTTTEEVEMMKKMNQKWKDYPTKDANQIDNTREKCAAYMYRENVWKNYKTDDSSYAIGSPSLEMFVKAYNVFRDNNPNSGYLDCKVNGSLGYDIYVNGTNKGYSTGRDSKVLDSDKRRKLFGETLIYALSSPNSYSSPNTELWAVNSYILCMTSGWDVRPVVPLDI